ncbi:hypothetical protein V7S43_007294 [Phytophthora oleae]|uniref:RxLR effector protein n=1 Tax=Phytophthora oleae TaxID=2107226 RepID=A0ABD3FN46_9STRA
MAAIDSRFHLSSVNFSTKRNLRTVTTVEEDEDDSDDDEDSEDYEERGLPGTSISAIESLATKADTAVSAAAKAAAIKAARVSEATKVKEWLAATTPVDDVFTKLKLNGAGDDLFKAPNLALWLQYSEKFDDATRAKTNSVISTLLRRYGDEPLLKLITAAKFSGPGIRGLSLDMTHNLLVKWATEGKSIRQVSQWVHNVGYEVRVRPSYIDGLVTKYKNMYAEIRHLPAGH